MNSTKSWQWVASLYFSQSIPFVVVNLIATVIYQQAGMPNEKITLLTCLLLLPWSIKPLFAPFLENIATKKKLTIIMQSLLSALFLVLSLSASNQKYLIWFTLSFISLALVSAMHDIVSDGIYLLNLDGEEQKRYIALRSFFYQFGRFVVKGLLLSFIGQLLLYYKFNPWQLFFAILFIITSLFAVYNQLKLPEKESQRQKRNRNYRHIFRELSANKAFYFPIIYIFLYNFSDAQLQKIIPLFLLDASGLRLNLSQVGRLYGIYGGVALILGVFISGFFITRFSLSACIKCFTTILFLSPILFLPFSFNISNPYLLPAAIMFYQLASGLANGAYMGYLLFIANKSSYPMSMYTICTSVMALSYIFFGALSGSIQQKLGYAYFFMAILAVNGLLLLLTYRMMKRYV